MNTTTAASTSTETSPKSSKSGGSPNYKLIKQKLRESFRKGKNYLKRSDHTSVSPSKSGVVTSQACPIICNYPKAHDENLYRTIHDELQLLASDPSVSAKTLQLIQLDNRILHQRNVRRELSDALEICRSNKEFQNSTELIESERLMLVSNLKELAAKEELTRRRQFPADQTALSSEALLNVVYFELQLRDDTIFDAHFNYYYVIVLTHRDKVECSPSKERHGNRVIFNDLKIQFAHLAPDFGVRAEVFVLRLRKNQRLSGSESKCSASTEALNVPQSSRFRFHGRTILRAEDLAQNRDKQFPAQRKLRRDENGQFVLTMFDIVDGQLDLYGGELNNLKRNCLVGFQIEIGFRAPDECKGFLDVAQKKWKWDRLWCRIDGFKMNFWHYPQEIQGSVRLNRISVHENELLISFLLVFV